MTESLLDRPVAAIADRVAPALRVTNLSKTYPGGDRPVVDEVELQVPAGQRVALIGANGAGKSTLLRCCLRLIEPDSGGIELFGRSFSQVRGRQLRRMRSEVGLVFQKHQLVPSLSALTNVLHGRFTVSGGPRRWLQAWSPQTERERALACLEQVGLADFATRPVRRLSGGQAQRVAIARVLMQNPYMFFADEPAASLDPQAGHEVMQRFVDLAEASGRALVFVSHHLSHATRYAERVVGLENGRVTLDTPTATVARGELERLYG